MLSFQNSEEWGRTPNKATNSVDSRSFPPGFSSEDRCLDGFRAEWLISSLLRERLVAVPLRQATQSICSASQTSEDEIIYHVFLFYACLPVPPVVWGCNLLRRLQGLETKACGWLLLWANNQKSNGLLYRTGCLCPVLACPQFCCCYRRVIQ